MLRRLLILIAVIVLAWVVFLPAYSKLQDMKEKNIELQQRAVQLQEENKKLRQEQEMLTNNPDYLEKVAREKMGLIKEGESVMRITPEESSE